MNGVPSLLLRALLSMKSEHDYARAALSQWCRNHGIYEIRQVLQSAVALAERCQSAEQLAEQLEEGIGAEPPAPVVITEESAPAAPAAAEPEPAPEPRRGKRRAASEAD